LNEAIAGFLVDECLSAELADLAGERGYHALAVNRMRSLRKRNDYRVAKYAVDRSLILVTNDFYDLAAVYEQFEFHPGVIFLTAATSKLRELRYQRRMFEMALDAVEEEEPIQQAIYIHARLGRGHNVHIDIDRYYLPDLK
jgi:predicted nuclease of predicted toxin-antitoxin system